jgi:hypothetical protein
LPGAQFWQESPGIWEYFPEWQGLHSIPINSYPAEHLQSSILEDFVAPFVSEPSGHELQESALIEDE